MAIFLLFLSQLRNTLKFLLGNLQGFDPRTHAVDPKEMQYLDQYMLHLLRGYSIKVWAIHYLVAFFHLSAESSVWENGLNWVTCH